MGLAGGCFGSTKNFGNVFFSVFEGVWLVLCLNMVELSWSRVVSVLDVSVVWCSWSLNGACRWVFLHHAKFWKCELSISESVGLLLFLNVIELWWSELVSDPDVEFVCLSSLSFGGKMGLRGERFGVCTSVQM
jgi:hypothetical protein